MVHPSKCSSHKTALIYELKQLIIKGKSREKFQKLIWDFQKFLASTSKWHIYHANGKKIRPKNGKIVKFGIFNEKSRSFRTFEAFV